MLSRVIKGLLITLVIISIPATAAYIYLLSSLQPHNAKIAVSGLTDVVDIVRDKDAIPHIYAKTDSDAFFALGFAHAQDRLWQMDMQRRISQGRLSEIAGESTLNIDKFLRTLGVYRDAEKVFPNLNQEAQDILMAYSAGVNQAITTWEGALPPEFLLTGTTPEPWKPADSIAWVTMMSLDLSLNWRDELMRARLLTKLTPQQVKELYPPYGNDAPVPLPSHLIPLYKNLPIDDLAWYIQEDEPRSKGSNNWVVSGARSATGKPLLANDPHLGMSIPSLWYAAHVNSPNFSVQGVSLPGVPAVVLGRNAHVAWAFTNTGPDTQDLFIEKINPENPDEYMTPDGWRAFEKVSETIPVRGKEPVPLTVRIGRNGPIMSDHHIDMAEMTRDTYAMAFAWTALGADNTSIQNIMNFRKAKSVYDFDPILRDHTSPMQSILFADTQGNIGWRAPGKVPIRGEKNIASGLVPVPGWLDEYGWKGFIPFDELPGEINPSSGMIYTANQKVVSDRYPHFLAAEWMEPYRANRIRDMLNERPTHSFSSFAAMHMDIQSGWATEFLPFLKKTPATSELSEQALGLLTGWDGEMAGEIPQPLILSAWYREFVRQITADELDELFDDFWGYHVGFMRGVISGRHSHWCDDTGTTDRIETCLEQSSEALERAMSELATTEDNNAAAWQWHNKHTLVHEHRPFSNVSFLRPFFERQQLSGGGPFTVNLGKNRFANKDAPFRYIHGPGFRAIYDLSNLNSSGFMISTGQSGNPLSAHYFDFAPRWLEGEYITLSDQLSDITTGMKGTVTLEPN